MACSPFDGFRMATESLGEELHLRATWRSIWLNLIQKSPYPQGTGLTQTSFFIGRNEPDTEEEHWEKIQSSITCAEGQARGGGFSYNTETDSASGYCKVCWNDTEWGFQEKQWSPEQFGLRGPILCQDDLIFNWNAERFLELYLRGLSKRSQRSIENRFANIYTHLVPKWIARAAFQMDEDGGDLTGGVAPNVPDLSGLPVATSELTQEMCDEVAMRLIEEGATDPDTDGWLNLSENGPVFPLFIGMRASQQIQLNNDEFREDYRHAEPSALLKRLGATRVIKNFRHVINLYPPRYNYFTGIGYVRIPTWSIIDGTKGTLPVINAQWRTAAYEGAWVLNPWVFHDHPVRPVNAAAGVSWDAKNYFGEWQWVVGGNEICDPDTEASMYDPTKKLGRHFAEYKHGAEPIFPEYGAFIIFKRCPTTAFDTVTCVS